MSLIFQTQERESHAPFMSSCRTGRETTLSEVPLEEVVSIIRGRKWSEESSVTLHHLPKQQRQTLMGDCISDRKQNTFSGARELLYFQIWKTGSYVK